MAREGAPPRVLQAVAALLVPAALRDEILGDLRERFHGIASTSGRGPATHWYLRQVLALRPRALRRQLNAPRALMDRRTAARRRGGMAWRTWGSDLRYAARSLRARAGASLTVSVTVALAIGATTAVFTVVNGVLLAPLPFPDSGRLVRIWQTKADWVDSPRPQLRRLAERFPFSIPEFNDVAAQAHSFSAMGAFNPTSLTFTTDGRPELVQGEELTSGVFRALGVQPALGRYLVPDDDRPGARGVIVLSYGIWRDRYGSDPSILGRDLPFSEGTRTVVGVMPPGFALPASTDAFWISLPEDRKTGDRTNRSYEVLGRLSPGATLATARSEMDGVMKRMATAYPDSRRDLGGRLVSLLDSVVGDVRATLWLLLGAVALVLAVACVNIANVLSVLGLSRRRELALKAALGAGAGRLAQGQLAESVILIGTGGAGGVALAAAVLPVLAGILPPGLPRRDDVVVNAGVLVFGLAITLLTALAVGLVPALQASRVHPARALGKSGRNLAGGPAAKLRAAFVVAEVALAFVLLVGAGLLGNSFERLWHVDRGFDTAGLAVIVVTSDRVHHPTAEDRLRFADEMRSQLSAIPGTEVTGATQVPLSGGTSSTIFEIERDGAPADTATGVLYTAVLENYFAVMRIPVVEGRGFASSDVPDAPHVAVVNEAMAHEYWPGVSPLGRHVRVVGQDAVPWMTVVGVARNVRHIGLDTPAEPKLYTLASQVDRSLAYWILRAHGNLGATLELAKDAVARVAPDRPIWRAQILEEHIASTMAVPRFRAGFVMGLAAMAAVLAFLGVYGVTSFVTSQRTREIGLRIALGSDAGAVVRRIMVSGLKLAFGGLAVGLAVAVPASRLVAGFLFGIEPTDPTTFAVTLALVSLVTALAAYVPARRAASVDPMQVLNAE